MKGKITTLFSFGCLMFFETRSDLKLIHTHTGESWFKPRPQVPRWFSFENVCIPFLKKEVIEKSLKKAMSDTIFQIMWRQHGLEHIRLHLLPMSTGNWRLQKCLLWSVFKKLRFRWSFSSDTRRRKKHQQKMNIIVPLSKDIFTYENSLYSINFPSVFVTKPKFLWGKLKKAKQRLK